MKALLVAIPVVFLIFLILGYVGNGGLGVVELCAYGAMAVVWVAALVLHLWRRWARSLGVPRDLRVHRIGPSGTIAMSALSRFSGHSSRWGLPLR
jgi:hypothetical protein